MIVQEFRIVPDERKLSSNFQRLLKQEKNRTVLKEAEQELFRLIRPVVVWERFGVQGFEHDTLILSNGVRLGGGPVVKVVAGATEVVLGIGTVGKAAEGRAREYMKAGETLKGLLIDELASWAVGEVRKQFAANIREEFAQQYGLRTSSMLSPGESVWSVSDQKTIFECLRGEAEASGIGLSESGMLVPFKSLSFLIGAGPRELGSETESNCDFCTMKDRCRFRDSHA